MNGSVKIKRENMFLSSAKTLSSVKNVSLCAMFMALAVVLEMLTITTPLLKISFSFLMFALCGLMFGPTVGMIFGASVDLLGVMVTGQAPYLPLTVVAALSGLMYGLLLYRPAPDTLKASMPLWRILVAQTLNNMVCNVILNTACIALLMNKGYLAIIGMRLVKNFILLPFEVLLLTFVIRTVEKVGKRFIFIQKK